MDLEKKYVSFSFFKTPKIIHNLKKNINWRFKDRFNEIFVFSKALDVCAVLKWYHQFYKIIIRGC